MVRSPTDSEGSAATQVKAVSPEISLLAGGQGLLCPEASIGTGVRRRVGHGMPPGRQRTNIARASGRSTPVSMMLSSNWSVGMAPIRRVGSTKMPLLRR